MPWELTIGRADRLPLGYVETVIRSLESALPSVRFYREPSGAEKMAAAGIEFYEVLRRHLEESPAKTQADYEGIAFSIRFFLGAGPLVEQMNAEIRGSGDPSPESRKLAEATGWVVIEDAGGTQVAQ